MAIGRPSKGYRLRGPQTREFQACQSSTAPRRHRHYPKQGLPLLEIEMGLSSFQFKLSNGTTTVRSSLYS